MTPRSGRWSSLLTSIVSKRMSNHPVVGLLFRCGELIEETEALNRMARPFLGADGRGVLNALKGDLARMGGPRLPTAFRSLSCAPFEPKPSRDYEV